MSRLVLNATHFRPEGMDGLNRYTSEVIRQLTGFFPESTTLTSTFPVIGASVKSPKMLARFGFAGNLSRLLWNQTALRRRLRKLEAELFFSPVPEGMLRPVCRQIITVHDLLPLRYPETYPRLKYYFRRILPSLTRHSEKIVTISQFTRKEVMELFGVNSAKIDVVYPGYDPRTFFPRRPEQVSPVLKKHGITEKYLLCVGESRPYKNFEAAIQAMAAVKNSHIKLVVVGDANRLNKTIRELPRKIGVESRVSFTGFVSDEELAALYSNALVFLFPSLYEGFGLPPLEAMACGAPVIASNRTSVPEVCGNAALYFDPKNNAELVRHINAIAVSDNLREELAAKSLRQAKKFSWKKTAGRIREIFIPYLKNV